MEDDIKCCVCHSSNDETEVTRQRCNHVICWTCFGTHVRANLAPRITCPVANCKRCLSDSSIRKILTDEEINRYEQKMMDNIVHQVKCLLPGCEYIFICSDRNVKFDCPNCSLFNCLSCNASHRFLSCEEYPTADDAQERCQVEIVRAVAKNKSLIRAANREMLLIMDATDLFMYDRSLECVLCTKVLARGDGVLLRCSHAHCKYCLVDHIKRSANIPIRCPAENCNLPLEEREILQLLNTDDFRVYIDRCNSCVKGKLGFTFQCQSPDCGYIVEYSTKPELVYCPFCKANNCTKCYAIHSNETCSQFKERIKSTPYGRTLLDTEKQIQNKMLMRCLKCHQILKKIAGCSWIQCSSCRFEMCWALQMARWGPKGRNDTSGGCRCNVNGTYCTPNCGSCIPHN